MSFVTEEKLASLGPKPKDRLDSGVNQKYSEAGFPSGNMTAHLIHAALGFLSSLQCTPPLASSLAALNRAAGTPTNESEAKICADQSEPRVDTGQTIVLGLGCIPSKADLHEHHSITCPAKATQTISG